jgi:hypothetical protein
MKRWIAFTNDEREVIHWALALAASHIRNLPALEKENRYGSLVDRLYRESSQ